VSRHPQPPADLSPPAPERIVARVERVGDVSERPILSALAGGRHFVPRGWTELWIDGECYRACFAGSHLSTVTSAANPSTNLLPSLLFSWFGAHAGRAGPAQLVAVERGSDGRVVLRPL
jgi:hypothetical protein